MTWSEAFKRVEDRMTALGLVDRFGEPLIGLSALPAIAAVVDDGWTKMLDDAGNGLLAPDEYAALATDLLEEFRRSMMLRGFEKKLVELSKPETKARGVRV